MIALAHPVRFIAWLLVATPILGSPVLAQRLPPDCGTLENAYGPFDYTVSANRGKRLQLVETNHFTSNVENLRAGKTGTVMDDLDYTLRAFPNHHRALYALANLASLYGDFRRIPGSRRRPECYYLRAIAFAPQDGLARAVYGVFLQRAGRLDDARATFEQAVQLTPDSPEVHYNFGLLLMQLQDYESALAHAERAYDLGFPLPGLRRQLENAGFWPKKSKQ